MKRGFTLIELLISIVLMMILMFAMMTIFAQTTDVVALQDARVILVRRGSLIGYKCAYGHAGNIVRCTSVNRPECQIG